VDGHEHRNDDTCECEKGIRKRKKTVIREATEKKQLFKVTIVQEE
jgi:hypothetical protein